MAVNPDVPPMMMATTTFVAGMIEGMKKKQITPAMTPITSEIKGINFKNFSLFLKVFSKLRLKDIPQLIWRHADKI